MKAIYILIVFLLLCVPTHAQTLEDLQEFLKQDPTNHKEYTEHHYCYQFSRELYKNGTDAGFKCTGVNVCRKYDGGTVFPEHCINAFYLEEGLFFVEPQTDSIYNLDAISYVYMGRKWFQLSDIRRTIMDPNPVTKIEFIENSDNIFVIKGEGKETV